MTTKWYLHLADSNSIYLLRPDFKWVRIADILVKPLMVERVDVDGPVFLTSVRNLVLFHTRKYGWYELRGVEVEGQHVLF